MTIGILLPRSTDYPAMGFDLLDGIRIRLGYEGLDNVRYMTENIGFGEDKKDIYAKAEKLLMQDDVDYVVGYLSPANAEMLYPLFESAGKILIVMDAGMMFPSAAPSNNAIHISLQGMHAAQLSGLKAGENGAEVIMATSFYDGGYRGPWVYNQAIEASHGKVIHNYVGHYKISEFTVDTFADAVHKNATARIASCFSTYLSTLFLNALNADASLPPLEMYCSSYMLEEQNMATYTLPDGKFFGYVPWASVLTNEQNKIFREEVLIQKKKTANIFHLLGWEAGIVISRLSSSEGSFGEALSNWYYDGPRGRVNIHPDTHIAYAPLYFAEMIQTDGNPELIIHNVVDVEAAEHEKILQNQPQGITSGWVNQYLCS